MLVIAELVYLCIARFFGWNQMVVDLIGLAVLIGASITAYSSGLLDQGKATEKKARNE